MTGKLYNYLEYLLRGCQDSYFPPLAINNDTKLFKYCYDSTKFIIPELFLGPEVNSIQENDPPCIIYRSFSLGRPSVYASVSSAISNTNTYNRSILSGFNVKGLVFYSHQLGIFTESLRPLVLSAREKIGDCVKRVILVDKSVLTEKNALNSFILKTVVPHCIERVYKVEFIDLREFQPITYGELPLEGFDLTMKSRIRDYRDLIISSILA